MEYRDLVTHLYHANRATYIANIVAFNGHLDRLVALIDGFYVNYGNNDAGAVLVGKNGRYYTLMRNELINFQIALPVAQQPYFAAHIFNPMIALPVYNNNAPGHVSVPKRILNDYFRVLRELIDRLRGFLVLLEDMVTGTSLVQWSAANNRFV